MNKVVIIKVYKAYHAYGDMLHYYAVKNLLAYMNTNPNATFTSMCDVLKGNRERKWVNLGGQLILEKYVDKIRSDIGSGKLTTWKEIHNRYDILWVKYSFEKQKHAFATLCEILGTNSPQKDQWISALNKAGEIKELICNHVYFSRKKDFDNPFRQATYRNMAEMKATIGTVEDDTFVKQVRTETEDFKKLVTIIKKRG